LKVLMCYWKINFCNTLNGLGSLKDQYGTVGTLIGVIYSCICLFPEDTSDRTKSQPADFE